MKIKYLIILYSMLFFVGCFKDVTENKAQDSIQPNSTVQKEKFVTKTFDLKKLTLKDSIAIMIQDFYGVATDESRVSAHKMILANQAIAQKEIQKMIQELKDEKHIYELVYVLAKLKLTDELRLTLFNLIKDIKKPKEKKHNEGVSNSEKLNIIAIELLHDDVKKGNVKSKDYLMNLLKIKDFPNKLKVVNMLLKLDGENRRSIQMNLKKILPKNEHYLLFRK